MKRAIGYTILAAATAPVWVPAVFAGYVGYKAARWAFAHPKTTIAALATAGFLWYAASDHGKPLRDTARATVVQTVDSIQRHKADSLEQRLRETRMADERKSIELKRQQEYSAKLEQQLNDYKATLEKAKAQPAPVVATIPITQSRTVQEKREPEPVMTTEIAQSREPPRPEYPPLEAIADKRFNFYYVKMNDTLSGISKRVTGSANAHVIIARDNGITDANRLVTGQLLKLRKGLCVKDAVGVHSRVPRLSSVILPGSMRISEYFHYNYALASETLQLNRHLGLMYQDSFPIVDGKRIVYYR